jgi:hypothetical protein
MALNSKNLYYYHNILKIPIKQEYNHSTINPLLTIPTFTPLKLVSEEKKILLDLSKHFEPIFLFLIH